LQKVLHLQVLKKPAKPPWIMIMVRIIITSFVESRRNWSVLVTTKAVNADKMQFLKDEEELLRPLVVSTKTNTKS
nr:hypothetical protein [Vibrio vulnificus]